MILVDMELLYDSFLMLVMYAKNDFLGFVIYIKILFNISKLIEKRQNCAIT